MKCLRCRLGLHHWAVIPTTYTRYAGHVTALACTRCPARDWRITTMKGA